MTIKKIVLLLCLVLVSCVLVFFIVDSDIPETTTAAPSTTVVPETSRTPDTSKTPGSTEAPHVHSFGEWVTVKEATCTEAGLKERACSDCLTTQTEAVEALGHADENRDHICDNECGKTDVGTHNDSASDTDHVCDYGCGAVLETCTDADNDGNHACDICEKADVTEHTYGQVTCDTPATCSECGKTTGDALGHADENRDHVCDRGCGKTDVGTHSDSASDTDHVCDYGCGEVLENCTDAANDGDHACDICGKDDITPHTYGDATCDSPATCSECGVTTGNALGHIDENRDHVCDNGCGKTDVGTHSDSASDTDHVCDYGCGKVLENCTDADNDGDHACDICDKEDVTAHTYGDATCDTPATCSECGVTTGNALDHIDENRDHVCDNGCGKTDMGTHSDSASDTDHVCDYGCGKVLENCTDAGNDGDHACDICGKEDVTPHTYSNADCDSPATCSECGNTTENALGHADENRDHICDRECGKTDMGSHADSAADTDHVCDYGCGAVLENCTDADNDGDHACDICGKEDVTTHNYSEPVCYAPTFCLECGVSNSSEDWGHRYEWIVVDLAELGVPCGGTLEGEYCTLCNTFAPHDLTNCNWERFGENADGKEVYQCLTCGAQRLEWFFRGEKDENCYYQEGWAYSYLVNGEEVFGYVDAWYDNEHNWEYLVENYSGNCKDGYTLTQTCIDCGESHTDEVVGHWTVYREVDLSELGLCGGYVAGEYCPACEKLINPRVICQCVWEFVGVNADGQNLYECPTCGAQRLEWSFKGEKDENCEGQKGWAYSYLVNGKEVLAYVDMWDYIEHNYEYLVENFSGNCEDGYKLTKTCTDCGESHTDEVVGHQTESREIDLSELGLCGGCFSDEYCFVCEAVMNPMMDCDCAWEHVGKNKQGQDVYECSDCGAQMLAWYIQSGEGQEGWMYSYLVNGKEVLRYVDVLNTAAHN